MKVFLCESIHPKAYEALAQKAEIISDWERAGEVDALLDRILYIGKEQLDKMPNLKVIAVHGTGTDGLDLPEVRRRGIQVVYAPHLNANAVAELAVGLTLALARRIVYARQLIDEGCQGEGMALLNGFDLRGKVFGILGAGEIARRTAAILRDGFGMKPLAWSRSLTPEKAQEWGLEWAPDKETVLKNADVVSLGMPLTDQTRGIIGEAQLALMKPTACLINTARGALVDEEALYRALKEGRIAGAACDVFCKEPPTRENPLFSLPNFVGTPHIGANTYDALYTVGMTCVEQILDVLEGRKPQYPL